jgi:hypothetical protein
MKINKDNNTTNTNHVVGTYNLLLNLFWSVLSFVPVIIFCYTWMELNVLILFVVVSLLPIFLTNAAIDKLQITGNASTYKKLGIAIVQQLSQNGAFINALIRKKYPAYKAVRYEKTSILKLRSQTYINEKFHLVGLVFFGLTSFFAFGNSLYSWAIPIMFINLFYNVYPILLQQYIRAKLTLHQKNTAVRTLERSSGLVTYKLKCMGVLYKVHKLKEPF